MGKEKVHSQAPEAGLFHKKMTAFPDLRLRAPMELPNGFTAFRHRYKKSERVITIFWSKAKKALWILPLACMVFALPWKGTGCHERNPRRRDAKGAVLGSKYGNLHQWAATADAEWVYRKAYPFPMGERLTKDRRTQRYAILPTLWKREFWKKRTTEVGVKGIVSVGLIPTICL